MRNFRIVLALPFLLAFLILSAGCDGENILAQETPEPEPTNVPGPGGPQGVTTVISGTVIAPSEQGCNGVDGINTGDTLDIVITSTGATTGNASVTVNGDSGGTIDCATEQSGDSIDSPPMTSIGCTVTSVSGGISGVKVSDRLGIGINFSFSPLTKQVGIFVNERACSAADITSLNAES